MIDAWDRFKPYSDIKKESLSLKGLAKLKYDMEHKEQLADYPDRIEAMSRIILEILFIAEGLFIVSNTFRIIWLRRKSIIMGQLIRYM